MFNPEKQKKAKALGYPENDYTLYHKISVKDFIASATGIEALEDASEIVIDDESILNHKKTTKEIVECCKDIKVLGKKELKTLLHWWKILKNEFGEKKEKEEEETKEEEKPKTLEELEDLEDEQIMQDIEKLKEERDKELRRKKKKANKEKNKLNQKMNLKMVLKGDEGPTMEEDELFRLKKIQTHDDLKKVTDQSPDIVAESEDETEVKKSKVVRYEKDSDHLDSQGLYYKDSDSELEFSEDDSESEKSGLGLSDEEEEEEQEKTVKPLPKKVKFKDEDNDDDDDDDQTNPLLTDLDHRDAKSKKASKAQLWFDKDIFKDLENEVDEDYEIDKMIEVYKKKGGKIIGDNDKEDTLANKKSKGSNSDDNEDGDSDYDSDYNVDEVIAPEIKSKKVGGKDGFEVVSKDKCKLSLNEFLFK